MIHIIALAIGLAIFSVLTVSFLYAGPKVLGVVVILALGCVLAYALGMLVLIVGGWYES